MNKERTIAYAGSLIQQSFGENLKGHGYLKWHLDENYSELVEIKNDYGFVNLYVKNEALGPDHLLTNLPINSHIKIRYLDSSSVDIANKFLSGLQTNQNEIVHSVITTP